MDKEISTKPYLIRALHDWCTDNGYTPYLVVSVDKRCVVPHEYVRDNEIVLNAGVMATHKLEIGNEYVEFQARFNGAVRQVSVPVERILAIYSRETGHGMTFEVDTSGDRLDLDEGVLAPVPVSSESAPKSAPDTTKSETKRPTLTRIK